jgi:hypothetical protein
LRSHNSKIVRMLEDYHSLNSKNEFYAALVALSSARELGKNIEAELMDFYRLPADKLSQISKVFREDVVRADFLVDYAGKLEDDEVILILSLRQGAQLVKKSIGDQLPDELLLKLNALDDKIEELKIDPTFSRQLARCNTTIIKNIGFDICNATPGSGLASCLHQIFLTTTE